MNPSRVIRAKRDGRELGRDELESFVRGFLCGEVVPYQMSAFLMAVYLEGMSSRETADLTRVMVETGETLTFPGIDGKKVDKHSTGGVGDLVSLPLAPLVAEAGVVVPMISGRGLGHTGGTLDKLESIPGLTTNLDPVEFRRVVQDVGFAMGGPTATLAPADEKMYALRDVTATVESVPLIVSSILSKKVAEGIDGLVLDVKCGRGAFMKTEADALHLADELTRVGDLLGKTVVAFVTDMDQPLGRAIGNAVEVRAALGCLEGQGPDDLMELVFTLGTAMLCLGNGDSSWEESREKLESALSSGGGKRRFRAMVLAQGGDGGVLDDPERLPRAPTRVKVLSSESGFVADVDPLTLGEAVVDLGGGRRRAEDTIDCSVGILLEKRQGDPVEMGETLATILSRNESEGERVAMERITGAFRVSAESPEPRSLIRHLVTRDGSTAWRGGESWPSGVRARKT
jgi:pyrimidine-nucleoside phosphorylase